LPIWWKDANIEIELKCKVDNEYLNFNHLTYFFCNNCYFYCYKMDGCNI